MELPQSIVYLYSKYSQFCNAFNEKVSTSGIDYLIPVCIDNKEVRLKILSSVLPIESVPCLLFVYPSGQIEKYEGQTCFLWIDEMIRKMTPVEPSPQPIQSETVVQVIEESPNTNKKPKKKVVESSDESEEEEIKPKKSSGSNKVVRGLSRSGKEKSYKTESENVEVIDAELGLESRPNSGPGDSSAFLTNLDDILGDRRSNEKLPIKNEKAGSSLMAKAQEMQKMRDVEDVKSPFQANRA